MTDSNLQYTIRGGDTFTPCGETVKTLKAGFYDVISLPFAGYGLKAKTMISDELIDIPGTIADNIFADIDLFLGAKSKYQSYSLTHKRGYLFWGPPGSGKTSLALMLGNRFVKQADGLVFFIGDYEQFPAAVDIVREVEPGRPTMFLIEEADSIIDDTTCLSILDGELSIQGAVFVAMTNYKDRLPPRIANRPGRFDRVELVAAPPAAVQLEYLRRVEARVGENPEAPEKIVQALDGISLSLAHLREAFISHVLMGVDLPTIRARFEVMSGKDPDEEDEDDDAIAEFLKDDDESDDE
jgi:SpoVK/Ycf46/Vps4 family AAA+-type ATPase